MSFKTSGLSLTWELGCVGSRCRGEPWAPHTGLHSFVFMDNFSQDKVEQNLAWPSLSTLFQLAIYLLTPALLVAPLFLLYFSPDPL